MTTINQVSFIGAGNLATQLSKALFRAGVSINQVYSRTMESAHDLAKPLNAQAITDLQQVNEQADLYIFAVKDDALLQVLANFPYRNKPMVHTAGSVSMQVLADFSSSHGVFYPLQTFSKNKAVDFRSIPICIESSSDAFTTSLTQLALKLSGDVRYVNSTQRQALHLAAVFVCNFVNYMYAVGYDLMQQHDLDFDLLKPLIQETAQKVMKHNPREVQTGPAVRSDEKVMNKQLDFLKNNEQLQELYKFVSKQIKETSKGGF